VVELDGGAHVLRSPEDEERQRTLESLGLTVMRFSNQKILGNLEFVLGEIARYARERLPGFEYVQPF